MSNVFVLTGKMELPRAKIEEAIIAHGDIVQKKVVRSVTHLVVGKIRGFEDTVKLKEAKRIGIPIIGTEELHVLLGDVSPFKGTKAAGPSKETDEARNARIEAERQRNLKLLEFYSQQEDAGIF
jgi:BRCT domain type II-containing protein